GATVTSLVGAVTFSVAAVPLRSGRAPVVQSILLLRSSPVGWKPSSPLRPPLTSDWWYSSRLVMYFCHSSLLAYTVIWVMCMVRARGGGGAPSCPSRRRFLSRVSEGWTCPAAADSSRSLRTAAMRVRSPAGEV